LDHLDLWVEVDVGEGLSSDSVSFRNEVDHRVVGLLGEVWPVHDRLRNRVRIIESDVTYTLSVQDLLILEEVLLLEIIEGVHDDVVEVRNLHLEGLVCRLTQKQEGLVVLEDLHFDVLVTEAG